MRILRNTLYVLTPETYLALDGENVVLQKGGEELRRIPLHNLEGIIAFFLEFGQLFPANQPLLRSLLCESLAVGFMDGFSHIHSPLLFQP